MKKTIIFLITMFCLIKTADAFDKKTVKFNQCVDGDTASVILDGEIIKLRFLAVDTPESVHPTIKEEAYGKQASNYTCNALKKAKKIEIEYDVNSDKTDKYNRHLVWVFVDGELLQEKLIEEGLAEVAYLYDNYKYTSTLEAKQVIAKTKMIGIWNEEINYIEIIITTLVILTAIVLLITNKNFRDKTTDKLKKKAKKELNKILKN